MKTKTAPVIAILLTYADAQRSKLAAETVLKESRPEVERELTKKNDQKVTHSDGMISTIKLTIMTRTYGIAAVDAAKVPGIGTATLLKLCSVDQAKAKAFLEAGVITQQQFNALTEPNTSTMIRVTTKAP